MSVLYDYLENYQQIARDHVAHWRATGENPFQNPDVLRANEDITVALIERNCPEPRRLLDAGCGMGDLLLRVPGVGVEIAEAYLEVAKERGLLIERAMIEELPFPDESFDAVVATDVLEHVLDLYAATKELLRVLRPSGHIIVRVPNAEPVTWDEPYGYRFIHLRILDEGTLRMLLGRIFGCEIVETLIADSLHVVARK